MSAAEPVVVAAGGTGGFQDADRLRARLTAAGDAAVVIVDVRGPLSARALDVLADAGRRLDADDRCLMLAGVDPALARQIAERGDSGSFAVVSPRVVR